MAFRGLEIRPEDTLLAERARDFLAGGPADAGTLVEYVCQQPGTPAVVAERIVAAMFAGRSEFTRGQDGRWRLTGDTSSSSEPLLVGGSEPVVVAPRVPTFDEWRAQRAAQAAAQQSSQPESATPSRRRRAPAAGAEDSTSAAVDRSRGPAPDAPLSSLSYVVVDVETTGGSPHTGHRITEIAAVVVRDGAVQDVFETLVNPQRPIPPMIMKLTGITMEMVAGKQPFRDICPQLLEALSGHVFVAHNVNFDWRFVTAEVARASGHRLEGPKLCTVRLARKLLPQLRSRSLGYVADHYGADEFARSYFEGRHGVSRPWRHSAAGDAVATAHCLLRLFRDAEDRGVRTWGELDTMLSGGTGRARRKRSAMPAPVDRDSTA
jgi:DNA polymerase-3 subunit epsilon